MCRATISSFEFPQRIPPDKQLAGPFQQRQDLLLEAGKLAPSIGLEHVNRGAKMQSSAGQQRIFLPKALRFQPNFGGVQQVPRGPNLHLVGQIAVEGPEGINFNLVERDYGVFFSKVLRRFGFFVFQGLLPGEAAKKNHVFILGVRDDFLQLSTAVQKCARLRGDLTQPHPRTHEGGNFQKRRYFRSNVKNLRESHRANASRRKVLI
jgi:hypothetical protein